MTTSIPSILLRYIRDDAALIFRGNEFPRWVMVFNRNPCYSAAILFMYVIVLAKMAILSRADPPVVGKTVHAGNIDRRFRWGLERQSI